MTPDVGPPAVSPGPAPSPLVSLVVPTYDVAAWLPHFLDALTAQTHPLDELEIVFVIDGATDDSEALVRAWAAQHAPHARVMVQENAGLSAARNRGLQEVTGQWVTFCDPDDAFDPTYFAEVVAFLRSPAAERADLVACTILLLDDATGALRDRHPLRGRFKGRTQVVDLEREPDRLHLQSASGFYRADRIRAHALTFDPRVRPNFEDAHFTARYLWSGSQPCIAFLPAARYHYRKRTDGSSLVQSSWTKPEKLTDLLEHGYLALMRQMQAERGSVPLWVQNLVLYEILAYLQEDDRPWSALGGTTPEVLDRFHLLIRQVVDHLGLAAIYDFRVVAHPVERKHLLAMGVRGAGSLSDVHAVRVDGDRQLVELRYYYRGDPPAERLVGRGLDVHPVHAKRRAVTAFGRALLTERILWASATGTVALELDGERRPLELGEPVSPRYRLGPTALWRDLHHSEVPGNASTSTRPAAPTSARTPAPAEVVSIPVPPEGSDEPVRKAGTPGPPISPTGGLVARLRRRRGAAAPEAPPDLPPAATSEEREEAVESEPFLDAWLFTDREGAVEGPAVTLFDHVRRTRPDVNAWLAMHPGSASGDRRRAAGEPVVEVGSPEHQGALEACRHVVLSTRTTRGLVPAATRGPSAPWNLAWLPSGVVVDDISRRLPAGPVSTVAVAGPWDSAALVADGTRSRWTTREVQRTGLPQHDRLQALAASTVPGVLLIAPAWRRLPPAAVAASDDVRVWRELLAQPALTQWAREHGLEVVVLAHPALPDLALALDPPADVVVADARTEDPAQLVARSALLVTDHSPLTFDLARLGRGSIYLQRPEDQFFSGAHGRRAGEWGAASHGFGPVVDGVESLLGALAGVASLEGLAEPYASRAQACFDHHDAAASERVVAAVEAATRPLAYRIAYQVVDTG